MMNDYHIEIIAHRQDKQVAVLACFALLLIFLPSLRFIVFLLLFFSIVYICCRFDVKHARRDFVRFLIARYKIERQLADAGFYRRLTSSDAMRRVLVRVPVFSIRRFSENRIVVEIRANIDSHERLQKLDLSPVFEGYRQMKVQDVVSRDSVRFEIERIDYDRQIKINSLSELRFYVDSKKIRIDKNTTIKTEYHSLLTGQTGAGKTYAMLFLLLSYKILNADVYVCDPKSSDLADFALSLSVSAKTQAQDIVAVVKKVWDELEARKKRRNDEKWQVATTATDNNLNLVVLMIDEFASLQLKLEKNDLQTLQKYLQQIVLEGRALGIFVVLGLQQANAQVLPTALREQFGTIVVLGNSGEQTLAVAFQESARSLPSFPLQVGEGWLLESSETVPVFVRFPDLRFLS